MLDAPGYPNAFLKSNNIKYKLSKPRYVDGKLIAEVEITD